MSSQPGTVAELYAHAAEAGCRVFTDAGAVDVAQLNDESRRLAGGLRELGVGPGDRVAVWMPNVSAYMSLHAACGRLGAIMVAVNTRFGAAEIADIVGRSEARVLVTQPEVRGVDYFTTLRDVVPESLPALRHLVTVGGAADRPPPWPAVAVGAFEDLAGAAAMEKAAGGPDDLVNIFTTSGTTSAPKFAAHRQAGVVGHAFDVAGVLEMNAGSVSLQLLPFCGVFGFTQAMAALAVGAATVMPAGIDAAEAVRLARDHGATHLFTSDDLLQRMLEAAGSEPPAPALRYCLFGGFNSWLSDLPARAEAAGVPMVAPFGMSEVMALFAARRLDEATEERHRAGGRLVNAQARVRARDPETGRLCPHGEAGELEIRGPNMFAAYFGDAQATQAAFTEDGFLRTGDLGYTEAGDAFTYLQRMNDTLRLSGFLVAPAEIEAAVMSHPAVRDAQVVAAGTAKGNRPVAFVIPEAGAAMDETAVIGHCGARLPKFKTPVRVVQVADFPVTRGPNGTKIQRTRLREMAEALLAEPG